MKKMLHALALAGGVALALSQTAMAEESIRFTSDPSVVGLAHWWAEEKGIFDKNGLKYTDTPVNTAYLGLQAIGADSNDVASMTEPPIITHLAKGIDAVVVGSLARSAEVFKMVVPTSVNSLDDLKGKKVTWMGGTGAEYAMIRLLEKHDMSVGDLDFVNLQPAEEVPTLLNGGALGMWSWEPWPRKVLNIKPGDYHVIATSSTDTYEANMVTVVRRAFAEEHPEALKAYLKSLKESIDDIRAHPDEAAEFYAKRLRISKAEADSALLDYKLGVSLDDVAINTLKDVAGWLKDNGRIEAEPDWGNIVDPSFLTDVDASATADLTMYKK